MDEEVGGASASWEPMGTTRLDPFCTDGEYVARGLRRLQWFANEEY